MTQTTSRFFSSRQGYYANFLDVRDGPCADKGFSLHKNCDVSLPTHKDKNNHGETMVDRLRGLHWWKALDREPFGPASTTNYHAKMGRTSHRRLHRRAPEWLKFDPRCYHAVEPVTSGRRVSLALFSPRAWRRIPQHALSELQNLGLSKLLNLGAAFVDANPTDADFMDY